MAASTAPVLKQNLLAQLGARSGLAGVGFNWAAPVDAALYAQSGDDIYLGDVTETQTFEALDRVNLPKDERYTVQVFAQAYRHGNEPQATEERCWAMVAEIEAQLREDPRVDGALNRYAHIAAVGMKTTPADQQSWLARATCSVACWARI